MKTDTRTRMLETTAALMRRQGYHGTGLNQIVAEAAAPKGSMYFHFPGGKEQLAAEAIAAAGRRIDAYLTRHRAATTLESLDVYVAAAAARLERSDFADGCPIATVALEIGATSDLVGQACCDAFELLVGRVAGWFVDDGVEPEEARQRAEVFYATVEGALLFAKASRSTEPLERVRAALTYLVPSPPSPP